MDKHGVANDERRTFMTTQNSGRERPGRRQFVDVVGIDLCEWRVACIGEVTSGHHPLFAVGAHFSQFFVGDGVPGRKQGRGPEAACK